MTTPPVWSDHQLESDRLKAESHFRDSRYTEPLEMYLEMFDHYQGVVEDVMEETVDLTDLDGCIVDLMSDPDKREVFRYLSGPPVSEDDLKVLMKAKSLSSTKLKSDPKLVKSVATFMRDWHDRRRFPWVNTDWDPSESDRQAAVLATSALLAMRRVETARRNEGKRIQELRVETQLTRSGFEKVPTRRVKTLGDAPGPKQFCSESYLGSRKADFIVGLFDGRTLGLECKVSNSSTNSVKRLNNDAAVKAEVWRSDFGSLQVVAGAVLSGVYALGNLKEAQGRGLTIFWAHDLQALVDWIHSTGSS